MLARALAVMTLLFPVAAVADPCTALLPAPGASFSGPVRHVGDGDSLCVGTSADPTTWIEVRLEDFDAPELGDPGAVRAKAALQAIVRDRNLICRAGHRSYDRVVARCRLNGASVGELMRRRGIREGGRGQ